MEMFANRFKCLLLALLFILLTFECSYSADIVGGVKGTVKYPKGKPVDGATVTITILNYEDGPISPRPYKIPTDAQGSFHQENLMPGRYLISVLKTDPDGLYAAS